jgi:hypothetical protein
VATVLPYDDNALAVIARLDDDHRCPVIVRAISVVVGTRVSMVVRLADHDLTSEVRIPEAERNPDARLSLRDASREAKQQSDNDECPFHGFLLWARV